MLDVAQGRTKPESRVSKQAQKGIEQFVNVILTSREKLLPAKSEDCDLLGLISHVLNKISFQLYLKQTHKENWEDRWANVEELVNQATQMATAVANGEEISDDALPVVDGIEQRSDTAVDILSKFLANVTLSSAADQDGSELNQVTISTIHAAKGLEWPVVFMPAVYDGSIPHSRADDQDEERRLLYVGMTRAQGLLYLSCPVKQSGQQETTLSRFISDRKIQKLFNERGPDLAFRRSTIPDLARILRRDCPPIADIDAARNLLERPEDDRYPATREEIDGDDPTYGAPWDDRFKNPGNTYGGPNQALKKRKLNAPNSFTGDSVSVTMNRTSGFSTATTTMHNVKAGFTSARDLGDLQAMQREAERIRMLVSAEDTQTGKAAYDDSKKAEAKPARAKVTKPRATGQGAITSFFKRSSSALSEEVEASPSFTAPSLQRSLSSFSGQTALHDISNVQSSTTRPPRPFQPLSIPKHKVTDRPILTKPKRNEAENTRYVLLSSSPVKPDTEDQPQFENQPEASESPIKQTSSSSSSSNVPPGLRPASTFHTTSMNQIQNQSAQRKTLGARRSMQPWSVKHSSMPKPRPS